MAPLNTPDLLRSLGLSVDGPARWGAPVASRSPGLIVVELPGGADSAPIDLGALRRWLDRVPSLTLDGERPSPQVLQRRLATEWSAGQPILFVCRATRGIGARLAGIYATTLGDARPASAGHWLKTLSNPGELRVWWAETPAFEEYEDALLEALGTAPWANKSIVGTLRSEAEMIAAAAKPGAAAAAARAAGTRKPAVRKAPTPRLAPRPMPAKQTLSKEGLQRLTAELKELREVARPDIIARVATARELGDLRENGDYQYARKEQSFIEGRIQALENLLRNAVVTAQPVATDVVQLGSTVEVEQDGERMTYTIVGTAEANIAQGRMSNASPVGRALMGARAGEEVTVQLPAGAVVYRVVGVS
ncbi:MAG TPA: transcription elongation factor GreA [Candidatus Limnocylindria bacterium]|nr:transcription elongation factor GreA [Candidatus Limnocylindria bacterium]